MSELHAHVPHELRELAEDGEHAPPDRAGRRVELLTVVLLSLTTLLTAWSGYEASRWSGHSGMHFEEASDVRTQAQRESTRAGQLRIDDLLYFNQWLEAHARGDKLLERVYRSRFRREFLPAFRAWLDTDPFAHPTSAGGPLYMPQYRLESAATAAALDRRAHDHSVAGAKASGYGDDFVLSTVFFAAVLFFAGISLRLEWLPLRRVVVGLASLAMLGGAIFALTLPVAW